MLLGTPGYTKFFEIFVLLKTRINGFGSTDRGEDKTSAFLTFHVKFMERLMKTSRGESPNLCFRALESEYLNPKLIVLKFFIVQIKCSI